MLARLADSTIRYSTGEQRLAFVAFMMRNGSRSKFVTWIAEGILLLLGRVSGAVCATDMSAVGAELASGTEEGTALVTVPSHSLTGFLVHKILGTALRGDPKFRSLLVVAIINGDGGVLLEFLGLGGSSLAASQFLSLAPLGRITRALLAAGVLAVGAFLSNTKGGIAKMTVAPHSHADRLLDTEGISLRGIPVAGVKLKAESLTELLRTLLIKLAPGDLGNPLGLGLGLGFLLGRFALLGGRLGANDRETPGGALALLENGLHPGEKLADALLLLLLTLVLGRSGCGCSRTHFVGLR